MPPTCPRPRLCPDCLSSAAPVPSGEGVCSHWLPALQARPLQVAQPIRAGQAPGRGGRCQKREVPQVPGGRYHSDVMAVPSATQCPGWPEEGLRGYKKLHFASAER